MPRRPQPTEKFPFEGFLNSSDGRPLGAVEGLFFRGFEKGADLKWRGQFQWSSSQGCSLTPGDSVILRRPGHGDTGLVVMNVAAGAVGFRCCTFGSPISDPDLETKSLTSGADGGPPPAEWRRDQADRPASV